MDRDEFRVRIRREEQKAKERPRLYRVRVAAFAGLGYAVYLGIILGLLLLLAGFAALMVLKPGVWVFKIGWKLGIPTFLGVVALVKALRVRLTPPSGYRLSKSDAPKFFELLETLRRKLRAPRFESILLTDDYNAGVLQIPRWGVLGSRNFLQVGMPLMQAMAAGRLLADRGDDEAVKLLEPMTRARDAELKLAASLWIARYHERAGNSKAVETALKHANEAFEEKEKLDESRALLKTSDVFLPHGLPQERVEELRKDLELLPFLKRAYLVRKEISDDESAYVLAIISKATARLTNSDDSARIQTTLNTVTLPPDSWVLSLDAETTFTPRIEKVEGALVFTAK